MFPRIVLIISILTATAQGVNLPFNPHYKYDSIDSMLWRGLEHIYGEDFNSAIVTFDSVILAEPTSPRGYFFVAATYSTLTNDYRNPAYGPIFYENINKVIDIGEARVKSGNATAEDLMYLGGAIGYRGIYRSIYGDWVGAFSDGLKGRSLLHQSFDKDTVNKDIYLGLGTYDYYRSAMTKALRWLPFFSDKRAQGVKEISIAATDGKFARFEAKYALVRVYYDYKKFDNLFALWDSALVQISPNEPFSLHWLGLAYIDSKLYDKALECFQSLLQVYLESPYYDPGGEMEVRYYMGYCFSKIGKNKDALAQLSYASLMAEALEDRKDIDEPLKHIKDLYDDVRDKTPDSQK
jgi:tetratricopeptide (TPR) repeat protein